DRQADSRPATEQLRGILQLANHLRNRLTDTLAPGRPLAQHPVLMTCRTRLRAFVASGLLPAFLCILALAASPQLHARFHPDAGSTNHECAVALIAPGKCEQADAPPLFVAAPPAACFEKIPALAPARVPTPFLGARIFEHAPHQYRTAQFETSTPGYPFLNASLSRRFRW